MTLRYGDGVHDLEIQRAIATILLASRGAALVYYGDEIGMKTTAADAQRGRERSHRDYRLAKGERPRRRAHADAVGREHRMRALPPERRGSRCRQAQRTINVRVEENDPNSLLAWYKALIRLKKTVPAFENGANIMLDPENTKVLSWMRQVAGAHQVVVCVNFMA